MEAYKKDRLGVMYMEQIPDKKKLAAVFKQKVGSVGRWGQRKRFLSEEVYMCLRGDRPYAHIRDAIAKELGLEREEIDRAIDGVPEDADELAAVGSD